MSFYNADPRAYFEWNDYKAYDATNRTVTKDDDTIISIDNLEVGRLVRIKDINSKSSVNNNYKIYKVTINNGAKTLEKFDLTNPYSLQIGTNTTASGDNSVAIGTNTLASGDNSVALGEGTVANKDNLTVIGQYNGTPTDGDLFIVGDGKVGTGNEHTAFKVTRGDNPDGTGNENTKKIEMNVPVKVQEDITIANDKKLFNNGHYLTLGAGEIKLDGVKYQPSGVTGQLTVTNVDDDGILLTTLSVANGGGGGPIKLRKTIPDSITIGVNLTVTGNLIANNLQAKSGNAIIISTNDTLKVNNIAPATDSSNTKIGNTVAAVGSSPETTSGLQYGNYPIKIVDTLPQRPSSSSDQEIYDNTIFIVLNDSTTTTSTPST